MRFAGNIPQQIRPLLAAASEDQSQWPSINRPSPNQVPDYRYDKHMREHVPNIPLKPA
jgi:hypothetical protein